MIQKGLICRKTKPTNQPNLLKCIHSINDIEHTLFIDIANYMRERERERIVQKY